jgi:hypothetical protein
MSVSVAEAAAAPKVVGTLLGCQLCAKWLLSMVLLLGESV